MAQFSQDGAVEADLECEMQCAGEDCKCGGKLRNSVYRFVTIVVVVSHSCPTFCILSLELSGYMNVMLFFLT